MRNQKMLVLIIIMFLIINNSYSQIYDNKDNYNNVLKTTMPQTSDFMKYGEIPVSLYTGQINFEIPIYQINDPDFGMLIQAVYTSDGCKPSKQPGVLGMDWFLDAGGVITREINVSPDDSYGYNGESFVIAKGLWLAQQEQKLDKDKLWNFDSSIVQFYDNGSCCNLPWVSEGYYYDPAADIFSFNFCGHKGRFMIANDGSIHTSPKGYKVDLSRLSVQKPFINNSIAISKPNTSVIKITSPDGYIYEFGDGSQLSAIEYSMSFTPEDAKDGGNPVISAWHLSRVIAPNGRMMNFFYEVENISSESSPIWQVTKSLQKIIERDQNGNIDKSSDHCYYSVRKGVFLKSIEIVNNLSVFFHNSKATNKFHKTSRFSSPALKLDSISISKAGDYSNPIQRYSLKYETTDRRYFLSEFKQTGQGAYKFKYDNISSYPVPDVDLPVTSTHEDIWGYYNKSGNADVSIGLLNSIIYPTGDETKIYYESHVYGKRIEKIEPLYIKQVEKASNSRFYPHIGGARVKRVEHITGVNQSDLVKEYFYVNGYETGKNISILESSGTLLLFPPYRDVKGKLSFIWQDDWSKNGGVPEPHIGYSSVIERFSDGSYISYCFSDYDDNPDYPLSKNSNINKSKEHLTEKQYEGAATEKIHLDLDNSGARGHLIQKKYFDKEGKETQTENYSYKNVSSSKIMIPFLGGPITTESSDPYSVFFGNVYAISSNSEKTICTPIVSKIYLKNYSMVYKGIESQNVNSWEFLEYDNNDLLSVKKIITNNEDTLKNTFKYSWNSIGDIYEGMKNKNILSNLTEKITYNSGIEIYREKINYHNYSGNKELYLPKNIETSFSGAINLKESLSYDKYNGAGRILQYTTNEGIPISCIWNGIYPIAEIRNIPYTDIEKVLPINTIDMEKINSLRELFPNAHITTYTYKPLVGMLTATDPRGVTTYYDYDEFGRLKETYIKENNVKKVIQAYNYNYANQ